MLTKKQQKHIAKLAREDAQGWLHDSARTTAGTFNRETIEKCLRSSVTPDEGLINALGFDELSRLFGVELLEVSFEGYEGYSQAGYAALDVYNATWRETLEKALE